jgi:hypothetical protein
MRDGHGKDHWYDKKGGKRQSLCGRRVLGKAWDTLGVQVAAGTCKTCEAIIQGKLVPTSKRKWSWSRDESMRSAGYNWGSSTRR